MSFSREARLLTIEETCAYLSVSKDTLRRMIKRGKLPEPMRLMPGERGKRFDRSKLDYYIDHQIMAE